MKIITRTVWVLSLVSLFTDMASEMLYPVMPVYLQSIGYSVWLIGMIEGVAEATAGLSKGYFGRLSDARSVRVPFVRVGYSLSALSKPMMGLLVQPVWILFSRTIDRLGKGIRTGARDAILSSEATPATKARVFGFHRSMDTMGAVLGPLSALIFLYFFPGNYRLLFFIAFVPGAIAVAASLALHKDAGLPQKAVERVSFFSFTRYWNKSGSEYRRLVAGLLFFALFNSSDVFLLLRVKESGASDSVVIGLYIFYNLVYALLAYPMGSLADKWGLKRVFSLGVGLFALVYLGMTMVSNVFGFAALFLLYGAYASATEGVAKAWITNIAKKGDAATAVGTYSAFQSLSALIASSFAGLLWWQWGSNATFFVTAAAAIIFLLYLQQLVRHPIRND